MLMILNDLIVTLTYDWWLTTGMRNEIDIQGGCGEKKGKRLF